MALSIAGIFPCHNGFPVVILRGIYGKSGPALSHSAAGLHIQNAGNPVSDGCI
jgi:hypothetical protein